MVCLNYPVAGFGAPEAIEATTHVNLIYYGELAADVVYSGLGRLF